jgi:hypothetical protein
MTATTNHELKGIEPDNLLGFLALLGLLRALDVARPKWCARVSWCSVPLTAVLQTASENSAAEMVGGADEGIRTLGTTYDFDRNDITYTADDYRTIAADVRSDRERARLLAAIASDGATKRDSKDVEPTALCAMFGQGHQHFLARLKSVAQRDDPSNQCDLSRALFEPWCYEDDTEGFRWDPIEDRRYAHQFGDPKKPGNKIGTVTGANRLAAIGFGVLTSVPRGTGLTTLGVAGFRRGRKVCWPLAGVPIGLAGYRALLAHPDLGDENKGRSLAAFGIRAISRARRYQIGKYFNFERARVQFF